MEQLTVVVESDLRGSSVKPSSNVLLHYFYFLYVLPFWSVKQVCYIPMKIYVHPSDAIIGKTANI